MDQKANDISLSGVYNIDSSHKTSVSSIGEESPANHETHREIRGSGVGALILKPLDTAIEDGDHIYAVIKGSVINQDDRTTGITAPSLLAQGENSKEIQKVALRTLTDSTVHSRSRNEATQQSRAASPTEGDRLQVSAAPLLSGMPFSQAKAIALESEKLVVQETQATAFPRLEEELARTLAQVLYMEESEVNLEKPFIDMGLDSILCVEWIKSINQQYAIHLKATIVYDYPTIRKLASFLQKDLLMCGGTIHQTPVQSRSQLSLDEVLQQVQQRNLDPQKAEQLLRQLSL
ncbi:MAG: hypothetical protein E6J34_12385 [Chloroflexi bacterium]|nr:MAG: hypothetical protein E6J34_12385 [Chloroflexota bacterium]